MYEGAYEAGWRVFARDGKSGNDGHFWYRFQNHRFGGRADALAFAFPGEARAERGARGAARPDGMPSQPTRWSSRSTQRTSLAKLSLAQADEDIDADDY